MSERNLILTGFMGAGKTSAGIAVARLLGREFVDMDAVIEERAGKTISEIFHDEGEGAFRDMEQALSRELGARNGLVVATGGGTLMDPDNYKLLSRRGVILCLDVSPELVVERLKDARDRPLLDGSDRLERVRQLFARREKRYAWLPNHISTHDRALNSVVDEIVDWWARVTHAIKLPVTVEGSTYHVHIGTGLLDSAADVLEESGIDGRAVIITNEKLKAHYGGRLAAALGGAFSGVTTLTMPDGEEYKTLETAKDLFEGCFKAGLDRSGFIVALGGGVTTDVAGFVASAYMRGVPVVQVPTSLLAMVDASVGGKTAVNLPGGKNLVGAFKQPAAVIVDPEVLSTLPDEEFRAGLAEVLKHGLLDDVSLLDPALYANKFLLPDTLARAIRVKIRVVEEDPYENGIRAYLNLGHTFAHALELISGYKLRHGEAVAIGMVAAAHLSDRLGLSEPGLPEKIAGLMESAGLPTRYAGPAPEMIWERMKGDKKWRRGRPRFIIIRALGEPAIVEDVSREDAVEALRAVWEAQ